MIDYVRKSFEFFQPPSWCYYCGKQIKETNSPVHSICNDCLIILPWWNEKTCQLCGKQHDHCLEKDLWNIDRLECVFDYLPPIDQWITTFKYSRNFFAGRLLASTIAFWLQSKQAVLQQFDLIIPISSHYLSAYLRGFNQSYFLIKKAKPIITVEIDAIKKIKYTKKQAALFGEDRLNLLNEKIFVVNKEKLEGKRVLIFDDVCTTGATINNLANELSQIGCTSSALSLSRKIH